MQRRGADVHTLVDLPQIRVLENHGEHGGNRVLARRWRRMTNLAKYGNEQASRLVEFGLGD